LTETLILWAF